MEIRPLDDATPAATRAALDRLLQEARGALVGPSEHLPGVDERIGEAAEDQERTLAYAVVDGDGVGLIDVFHFRPDSGAFTVQHLVVAPKVRGRGIGRALVDHAQREAEARGLTVLYAATRPGHARADAFWQALGAELVEEGPTRVFRRGE